jgi:hypothetical protein
VYGVFPPPMLAPYISLPRYGMGLHRRNMVLYDFSELHRGGNIREATFGCTGASNSAETKDAPQNALINTNALDRSSA